MGLIPRLLKVLESRLREPRSTHYDRIFENFNTKEDPAPHPNFNQKRESPPPPEPATNSQTIEDLAIFDLTLPTTLEALTQKRNALLRTYHPDKFENYPEKKQTANEMIQLINGAYERLSLYLKKTTQP